MCFKKMAWAIDQRCSSAGQKLVLLMLANHANGHTGQCNPSHKRLAEECSMGVSTLKAHIAALESAGLLQIVHRANDGVSLPNQYALNADGVGQNLAGGGSEPGRGVGQNLATKPGSYNLEDEPNTPIVPKGTKVDGVKTKKERRKLQTLSEYLASIPADGYAISPDDLVYERGIPADYINLAWQVFKDRFTTDPNHQDKKYKSWSSAFRQYIDGGFLRLWYSVDGVYQLTTAGQQAQARFAA